MKKVFFLIALIIPIIVFFSIKYHFEYYDSLGKKYDCYPIKDCKFDINGDSITDFVETVDESTRNDKFNYRLKVFLNENNAKKEILNLKYEPTDNTYRTHIAFVIENDKRKIVIYDTLNEHQFFYWNGQFLKHNDSPSPKEKQIRKALGYNDDTGGFRTKIFYPFFIIPMMFVYYFILFLVSIIYYYKKLTNNDLP